MVSLVGCWGSGGRGGRGRAGGVGAGGCVCSDFIGCWHMYDVMGLGRLRGLKLDDMFTGGVGIFTLVESRGVGILVDCKLDCELSLGNRSWPGSCLISVTGSCFTSLLSSSDGFRAAKMSPRGGNGDASSCSRTLSIWRENVSIGVEDSFGTAIEDGDASIVDKCGGDCDVCDCDGCCDESDVFWEGEERWLSSWIPDWDGCSRESRGEWLSVQEEEIKHLNL